MFHIIFPKLFGLIRILCDINAFRFHIKKKVRTPKMDMRTMMRTTRKTLRLSFYWLIWASKMMMILVCMLQRGGKMGKMRLGMIRLLILKKSKLGDFHLLLVPIHRFECMVMKLWRIVITWLNYSMVIVRNCLVWMRRAMIIVHVRSTLSLMRSVT